jgi:hypothetical protein
MRYNSGQEREVAMKMNPAQALVLWIGGIIAIAMCIYPPFMQMGASTKTSGQTDTFVEPTGYDWF